MVYLVVRTAAAFSAENPSAFLNIGTRITSAVATMDTATMKRRIVEREFMISGNFLDNFEWQISHCRRRISSRDNAVKF